MKTRIITGILMGIVAIWLIFSNIYIFNVAYVALSFILMYEMLNAAKVSKIMLVYNLFWSILVPLINIFIPDYFVDLFAIYLISIFILHIFTHKKTNFNEVSFSVFSHCYIHFLIMYVARIKYLNQSGVILLILVASAVFSDTFAYFIGVTVGKHKLCPAISPKKTIEGSVGGFLGGILSTILICLICNKIYDFSVNYIYALIYGVICGGLSQLGDLTASSIKRYYNIKDYGGIFPGHGGFMDRLDSIMMVAPILYLFMKYIPFIGI